MKSKISKVRPGSKNRITLEKNIKNTSNSSVTKSSKNIPHEPTSETPEHEAWLYKNKKALQQVKKGLHDSATGRVKSRGVSHQ